MWSYNKIKTTFLDYFICHDHCLCKPSSLIPKNDPSLLFTNAGMVQFKDIFMGKKEPEHTLATNSQKCIRAEGKHNDLDDVGSDSYHHTFFEMLGTWSFNYDESNPGKSYFKDKAIDLTWDLLINIYGLDKNKMYVTYYEGNSKLGIPADHVSRDIWKKYLPEKRILPFGKDNFWQVDDIGNCGPSSEVHYDVIGNREVPELVNQDDSTLIEIWNMVFMQYYINKDGLTQLPKKHVDTGMGLERITSILQGCTNYQIDIFKHIIQAIESEVDGPKYQDIYHEDDVKGVNMAYRVLADHARTSIVVINDGVTPNNVRRGYVLRRIIRRAIINGRKFNAPVGFFSKIVEKIMEFMVEEYPEISGNEQNIVDIVVTEENKFNRTINKGVNYFNKLFKKYGKNISTSDLFVLYTRDGFPIDIIKYLCVENGIHFNVQKYDELMKEHIQKSKR